MSECESPVTVLPSLLARLSSSAPSATCDFTTSWRVPRRHTARPFRWSCLPPTSSLQPLTPPAITPVQHVVMTQPTASPSTSGTPFAIVTLITTDAYLPGALALSASLAKHLPSPTLQDAPSADESTATSGELARSDIHTVALVTPASLSPRSIKSLGRHYDRVVGVEHISLATSIVDEATKRLGAAKTPANDASKRSEDAKAGRRIRREAARNLALLGEQQPSRACASM